MSTQGVGEDGPGEAIRKFSFMKEGNCKSSRWDAGIREVWLMDGWSEDQTDVCSLQWAGRW